MLLRPPTLFAFFSLRGPRTNFYPRSYPLSFLRRFLDLAAPPVPAEARRQTDWWMDSQNRRNCSVHTRDRERLSRLCILPTSLDVSSIPYKMCDNRKCRIPEAGELPVRLDVGWMPCHIAFDTKDTWIIYRCYSFCLRQSRCLWCSRERWLKILRKISLWGS